MKYWNPIRNFLLCELLSLFLGLSGQRFYALPNFFLGIMLLAAVWGSILGLCQGKKTSPAPALCFLAGMLVSAILWYRLFLRYVGAAFTGTLLVGIVEAICFLFTARSQDSFYGPLGVSTVLLSLSALLLSPHPRPWLILAAGAAMLLNLDGFRVMSLYRSHHMGKSGHISQRDPGLFRSNTGLFMLGILILFCTATLVCLFGFGVFAVLKLVWHTASGPLHEAAAWFSSLLVDFWTWFISHFHEIGPEGGSMDVEIKPHYQFNLPETSYMISWLPLAGLIAILATIGFATFRFVRKNIAENHSDYVDEIEFLERPAWNLRHWLNQRRTQRITDFSDHNLKIRFVFQQFLREKQCLDSSAFSQTPNELADRNCPLETELVQIYNRVRYAGENATDKDVLTAAQYLEKQSLLKHKHH